MSADVAGSAVAVALLMLLVIRAFYAATPGPPNRYGLLFDVAIVALLAVFLYTSTIRFIELAPPDLAPTPGPNPSRL